MKIKYFFIFFVFAFLILFLRRTDSLLRPQFWAEEGTYWFANAYNLGGVKSLFLTEAGYFQTFSRIAALISLAFPIMYAPLVFAVIALCIQTLPALFIISSRFEKIIPKLSVRLLLASLYLFLPNTAEIHATVNNSLWFLGLMAFMVLVADKNRKRFWNIFDSTILILSGLSGPFSIFLLPIAFTAWLSKREKRRALHVVIVATTAVVQLLAIVILNHEHRLHIQPELNIRLILAIVGRQIVLGPLIGANGYSWILHNVSWYFFLVAITTFVGLLLIIYTFIKAPLTLKLFQAFSILIFAASLISPAGDFSTYSPLKLLSRSSEGIRYWLIPMCAFITTLIWDLSKSNPRIVKVLAGTFLISMLFGIILDFQHPEFVDYQFNSYIHDFQQLSKGQKMIIPINPPGWSMDLVKH